MKRARFTLVLFLVAAALIAYVLVFERGEAPEGPLALRLEPKQVTGVEIKDSSGGLIRLTHRGDSWRLAEPVRARADEQVVTQLLDDLKQLADQGEIAKHVKDLKQYGLDKPRATLTIFRRGKRRVVVLVGNKTPDSTNAYAQLQGAPRVFMVRAAVADELARSASDFRDKTVLAFGIPQVRRLELASASGSLVAARQGQNWRITEPLNTDGDAMALNDLVTAAHDLKAAEFVSDKPPNLGVFGLDKPRLEVRLWTRGRGANAILFGGDAPAGRVYVGTSEGPSVYSVAKADFDKLNKSLRDLRSKQVLAFEPDQVRRIALKSPSQEVEIVREGKAEEHRWQMAKPVTGAADDRAVEEMLFALSGLRADDFVDQPGKLADFALETPRLEASVTVAGRDQPLTLLVGRDASAQPGVFVKRGDQPTIFRVSSTVVTDLAPDPQRFQSRQVLKLNRDDIQSIVLEYAKTRIVMERQGKERWEITLPQKVEADPAKVAGILFTVEDLRGDKLAAGAPTDLAPYGLDKPRLAVEVRVKGRAEPERLLIGAASPDGRQVYLKRASAPQVYLKDRFVLDDLRKGVGDLKK